MTKKKSLDLIVQANESDQKEKNKRFFIEFSLVIGLYVTLIFSFQSMFNLSIIRLMSLLPGFMITGVLFAIKNTRIRLYAVFTLIAVLGISLSNFFLEGLLVILNEINQTIGKNTGVNLPEFSYNLKEHSIPLFANVAWSIITTVSAIIVWYIVTYNKIIFNLCILMSIFIAQGLLGLEVNIWLNLTMLAITLLIIVKSQVIFTSKVNVIGKNKGTIFFTSSVILLAFLVISSIALVTLNPISSYEKNIYAQKLETYLTTKKENIRYEKSKLSPMTQGELTTLSTFDPSEDTALEVVMSQPTSLYLRGYVGSQYTGKRWENLESETYYNHHGLFYWLEEEGFNPLNQLDIVNGLRSEENRIGEIVQVTINNINANSKYLYTPYNLHSTKKEFDDVKTFDDSMLQSTRLFGNRLYSFDVTSDLVTRYPALATSIYSNQEDKDKADYLNEEEHYNKYVYETYTEFPEDIENMLSVHLGVENIDENEHSPYEQAIELVRDSLKQTINYRVDPAPLPDHEDFIINLLEHSQEGYSVHFATAATLMFRYIGIPSRYIEGYLVTPDDIENKESYTMIDVKESNLHAWTEIYLDQIGWIPIEVTPPYYDVMEPTDLSEYPSGESETDIPNKKPVQQEALPENSQQIHDEDDKMTTSENNEIDEQAPDLLFIVFGLLLLVMVVIYLIYVFRRRLTVRKMNKVFESSDFNAAIMLLFSYTLKLLYYDGVEKRGGSLYSYVDDLTGKYDSHFANDFKEIVKLNQKAVYSNKQMSRQDVKRVKEFKDITLENVTRSKSIFKKIKMKFWDYIY